MTQPANERSILSTYLSQGFSLLPVYGTKAGGICLCPSGAACKRSIGKHPNSRLVPNGVKNASRDKAIIAQWGRAAVGGNWGMVTGEPLVGGGFLLVLDVDPRNGGTDTLASVLAAQGPMPKTVAQDSGGNGEHYLFRTTVPMPSFSIGPGLETKGAGGYILVEPSSHASGGSYTWRMGLGPEDIQIADAPEWLIEAGNGGEAANRPAREGEGTARDTILGEAFSLAGLLGTSLPDGCIAVRCPWAEEHSDARGRGQDSSTAILPPAGGSSFGGFSCKHSHCVNRKWTDVMAALPSAVVEAARRKYPLKPVILSIPEDGGPPVVEMQPSVDATAVGRKALYQRCNFKETKGGHKLTNDPVNIATILTYADEWQDVLAFDEFSQVMRFTKDPPWHADDAPGTQTYVWTDADSFRLVLWFKRTFDVDVNEIVARNAAVTVALQNSVNPLTEYLDSLVWDRVHRIDKWLAAYLGAADNDYSTTVGSKWLISAVARAYTAGCKADHVLILEGPQGRGKSTALATLTGQDWFSDTPFDVGSKDAYLAMRGKWVIELAELASLNRTEADKLKAFFSSPADTYRPPYGREMQTTPRRCVFAGSVNLGQYLRDDTGNRRYWPVTCGIIDNDALRADRDQIWAEAIERFRLGATWWPENQEQRDLAAGEQEEREVPDAWNEDVGEWLKTESKAKELYAKEGFLRSKDITERALGIRAGDLTTSHQMRVANVMRQIGWQKTRIRIDGVRTYGFSHHEWDREVTAIRKEDMRRSFVGE